MAKRKRMLGVPQTTARGHIFQDQLTKMWYARVVNVYGTTVWRDNCGPKGLSNLIQSTSKMVVAVRLMDSIGQGENLKDWWVVVNSAREF